MLLSLVSLYKFSLNDDDLLIHLLLLHYDYFLTVSTIIIIQKSCDENCSRFFLFVDWLCYAVHIRLEN